MANTKNTRKKRGNDKRDGDILHKQYELNVEAELQKKLDAIKQLYKYIRQTHTTSSLQ